MLLFKDEKQMLI